MACDRRVRTSLFSLLGVGVLTLFGCGGSAQEVPRAADVPPDEVAARMTSILRGELIWGHESRSFTQCGATSETASWVVDETGGEVQRIHEELSSEPYQPLFFEVLAERAPALDEGFGAEYVDSLVVREVRRAEYEGWGCREDLSDLAFRAAGTEPFWSLEIRTSGLTLRRPDLPEPLEWAPVEANEGGDTVSYFADGENGTLEIEFRQMVCVDAMAGSYFPYVAEVRLAEQTLTGCALTGDGGP
jgi:putative lipoprotein